VAIDRSGVGKTQFLEQRFGMWPGFTGLARAQACEGAIESAHVFADRHAVVVQHHEHVGCDAARVVQRFVGHAARDGAIADHRDHLAIIASALQRDRHAQRRGNRR